MNKKIPKFQWHLEKRKVSDLKEWDKNPRELTKKGMKDLRNSVEEFGIAEPIVINLDNLICGGHERKKILEEMQIDEVDCYLPNRLMSDDEFQELNVRLNKNVAGQFVMSALQEFGLDFLHKVGFTDDELDFPTNQFENEKNILNSEKYLQKFSIIIECENEDQQEQLYLQLQKQGLKCKILSI
jgi:site-specific DNA-methyltransferase (adenine-specific)